MALIEAGDRHEIRNTGRTLLKTVSVYVPPAYRDDETELPAGKGAPKQPRARGSARH